jgi:hypothetical protein
MHTSFSRAFSCTFDDLHVIAVASKLQKKINKIDFD